MFDIELYEPLKAKITQPIAEMRKMVVDTGGQGRLELTDGFIDKHVSTCMQYETALSENFYTKTTYDQSIMSYFTLWCGSLVWLEKAKPAKQSFVTNFSLAESFGKLPAQMAFTPLGQKSKAKTLIEKYPDATLTQIGKTSITLESKQSKISMVINLLAKADFSGSHQQELLVSVAQYALQGSYRQYGVVVVAKPTKEERYFLINEAQQDKV